MAFTQLPAEPPRNRKPSWFEKSLLLIGVAILLVLLLRMLGIPVVHRTEHIEVLEHPHR